MFKSRNGQRLMGLILLVVGITGTAWTWHSLFTNGYYYRRELFFPMFAMFAFGFLLFPLDPEVLKAKYGTDKLQSFGQAPLSWKIIGVLALLAALGNWYALSQQ